MIARRASGAGGLADYLPTRYLLIHAGIDVIKAHMAVDCAAAVIVLQLNVVSASSSAGIPKVAGVRTTVVSGNHTPRCCRHDIGAKGQGKICSAMSAIADASALVVLASTTALVVEAVVDSDGDVEGSAKAHGIGCSGWYAQNDEHQCRHQATPGCA